MNDWIVLGAVVLFGWVSTTLLVPSLASLCHRRGWLDHPGPHKVHARPTPRLTGSVLFIGIWTPLLIITLAAPQWLGEFQSHALPVFGGAAAVLILGMVDDLWPLRGSVKLAIQACVGVGLYVAGISFTHLWIPFVGGVELGAFSMPVTIAWFLILLNAVNIIDGIDGLAVGTTAVATLTMIWVSETLALRPIWIGSAGLLGALVGFWRFNRPPAKVFMGDSGSLSVGYFLAVVALLAPIKRFTVVAFFVPVFALFLPLAESTISVARRFLTGSNPLRGDRGHLHHLLLRAGWSGRRIVGSYVAVTAVFGVFSVLLRYGNHRLVAAGMGIFVLLIGVGLGIILRSRGTHNSDQRPPRAG